MTSYSYMTDAEYLRKISEARTRSPVIEELARRLEKHMDSSLAEGTEFQCEVCLADLVVKGD